KKAKVKTKIRREKDIKGHLLGEAESAEKSKKKSKKSINFWWVQETTSSSEKQEPYQKLLAEDFQIMQAYNYLKAWDKIQGFSVK
ncbi:MAG: hypothetical protein KDD45_17945, partial [Bdellovibrionales bacterium]|nr:hypothetical protein [Bdellovibrionales bacterium]